jgi:hypothetical protein
VQRMEDFPIAGSCVDVRRAGAVGHGNWGFGARYRLQSGAAREQLRGRVTRKPVGGGCRA